MLVISGTIPAEPGVGGVILQDLLNELPDGMLQCVPAVTQQVKDLGWLERPEQLAGHVLRRYETGWRPVSGIVGETIGWASRKAKFEPYCRQLITQICKTEAAQACDKVWAILDCPTIIQIAVSTAERLKKPLVVLVWDSPELLVKQFNMDRWSASAMLAQFRTTLGRAERIGVICEQMQQTYERLIGPGRCVVMRHGIRRDLWADPRQHNNDRLVIGFAGSITAQQPFRQLVATLDANRWLINHRPVTLRMIGSRYILDSRQPQHIEYFGWRSLEATVRLLAESHVLYLPQPFEPHLRPLAELSFPTKLTTYLAAGQRVLLHAPDYASVNSFMAEYPIGLTCSSLEIDEIGDSLAKITEMPGETLVKSIIAARENEFSSNVFVSRFHDLIGSLKKTDDNTRPACAVEQA
jgi:hypothetical protein